MPPRTTPSGKDLGDAIKARRTKLGLTIEEAAFRAGIGTKTWVRYESGSPIRTDKVPGVCKALRWANLGGGRAPQAGKYDLNVDEESPAWPYKVCRAYGRGAAVSFVAGSGILLDYTIEDLKGLSRMPRGSHIGEIGVSWLKDLLPKQFLTRYDYEFVYALLCANQRMREDAERSGWVSAHTILDVLAMRAQCECARILMEGWEFEPGWDNWLKDVYEYSEADRYLFSDEYLPTGHMYHFDNWGAR